MQKFSIEQWAAWDLSGEGELAAFPACLNGVPAMAGVGAMVKRRMPIMAKAMYELSDADAHMPTVYASKNSELTRTIKLIRQFGGDLSPALFSMSVHNAIPGLLSVVRQDHSPYTVIDSMSGVVEMAVLEAVSLLKQYPAIKVMYFEEPTVTEFKQLNVTSDLGVVLKLIVTAGDSISLRHEPPAKPSIPADQSNTHIKKQLAFLQGDSNRFVHQYARLSWLWERH